MRWIFRLFSLRWKSSINHAVRNWRKRFWWAPLKLPIGRPFLLEVNKSIIQTFPDNEQLCPTIRNGDRVLNVQDFKGTWQKIKPWQSKTSTKDDLSIFVLNCMLCQSKHFTQCNTNKLNKKNLVKRSKLTESILVF